MTNVSCQHGALGTLTVGLLEGTISINDLLEHGDLGTATLTDSDGEVISVDGRAYHVNEHKEFIELTGDEMTPCTTITKLKAGSNFKTSNKSQEKVFDEVKKQMRSESMFSTVKISGTFKRTHVRMMPGQEPPYTCLIDSARRQPEETRENIEDSIVGFLTLELFHGISSAGPHIHSTNDDRDFGGYILNLEVNDATVEIQNFETFEQRFPIDARSSTDADTDYKDIADEIRETE